MTPTELPRDVSVPVDGDIDGLPELRDALDGVAPPHTVRYVLQRVDLVEQGRPAGTHDVIDAILDCDGNLVRLSLRDAIARDRAAAAAVGTSRARVDAWLDAHDAAARDVTEIVMDADGGHEVRVAFDVEVSPAEALAEPAHPAIHDGTYHATHRAPDLDALRDRLEAERQGRLPRAWQRLRAALSRRA